MQPDFANAVDLSPLRQPIVRPMSAPVDEEPVDEGVLKWEEVFFAILMWPDRPPVPTDSVKDYNEAVKLAKSFRPSCDAFEVKKVTRKVGGRMAG